MNASYHDNLVILAHINRFWNNLHQVLIQCKQEIGKTNNLTIVWGQKPKYVNMIALNVEIVFTSHDFRAQLFVCYNEGTY